MRAAVLRDGRMLLRDDVAEAVRVIAEGEIDVAPLVTGEVGLDGVGAAFDDLASPDTHCKILVTP